MKRLHITLPALFAGSALLSACSSVPAPHVEAPDYQAIVRADSRAVREGVTPLGPQLGLDEAIARALKFNLDRRARQMEEALALRQFEEIGYDRLPKLLAAAGYTSRDKDHVSTSTDAVTGAPSLANPSISQDKSHTVTSLTLSWSLLDYGLAAYNARQAGDRMLAAAERRRKATHQLVQEVRTAYWRAASAQNLRNEVQAALALAEEALVDSRKAEEEKLRSPLDTLRYQRQLTENMRLLEFIQQDLATARFDLAALINAPVTQDVALAADETPGSKDPLAVSAEEMEEQALAQNADLREHVHLRHIAALEARKTMLHAYPNLTLSLGELHDSDSHLSHASWSEAGVTFSFNLLNLMSLPAQKRTSEATLMLADQRRLAAHVAVVAQVHVAREQLAGARRQYERADTLWKLDDSILKQTLKREEARAGTKLDRVAAQTTAIVSQLRRYQALAQWHGAVSRLQATLGVDPLPDSSDELNLAQIRDQVRQRLLDL